jgi:hypothetical protein
MSNQTRSLKAELLNSKLLVRDRITTFISVL